MDELTTNIIVSFVTSVAASIFLFLVASFTGIISGLVTSFKKFWILNLKNPQLGVDISLRCMIDPIQSNEFNNKIKMGLKKVVGNQIIDDSDIIKINKKIGQTLLDISIFPNEVIDDDLESEDILIESYTIIIK